MVWPVRGKFNVFKTSTIIKDRILGTPFYVHTVASNQGAKQTFTNCVCNGGGG